MPVKVKNETMSAIDKLRNMPVNKISVDDIEKYAELIDCDFDKERAKIVWFYVSDDQGRSDFEFEPLSYFDALIMFIDRSNDKSEMKKSLKLFEILMMYGENIIMNYNYEFFHGIDHTYNVFESMVTNMFTDDVNCQLEYMATIEEEL